MGDFLGPATLSNWSYFLNYINAKHRRLRARRKLRQWRVKRTAKESPISLAFICNWEIVVPPKYGQLPLPGTEKQLEWKLIGSNVPIEEKIVVGKTTYVYKGKTL